MANKKLHANGVIKGKAINAKIVVIEINPVYNKAQISITK